MKKLIILFIAIAAISSAEWTFNEKDLYSPDPTWHRQITGETVSCDTTLDNIIYSDVVYSIPRDEPKITGIKLTDDGKLEVYYRSEGPPSMYYKWGADDVEVNYENDEVWKDVYEARVKLSMTGWIIHADTVIVKTQTIYGKVIPEKTIPERIEWEA